MRAGIYAANTNEPGGQTGHRAGGVVGYAG